MTNPFMHGFNQGQSIFNPPQGIFTPNGFQTPPVNLDPVDLFQGPFPDVAPIDPVEPIVSPQSPVFGTDPSSIDRDEGVNRDAKGDFDVAPVKTDNLGDFLGSLGTAASFGLGPLGVLGVIANLGRSLAQDKNPTGQDLSLLGNLGGKAGDAISPGDGTGRFGPPAESFGGVGFGGDVDSGIGDAGPSADSFGGVGFGGDFDGGEGDGDGGGGDKIICAELHKQGLLSTHIFEPDERYGDRVSRDILSGYHLWAKPVVRWMRKSHRFAKFMSVFARPVATELAKREGVGEGNLVGRFLLSWGEPLCGFIGAYRRNSGKSGSGVAVRQ